jgi:CRP/FNR family transcriptional regulator, cyclic AMP receptor protein
MDYKLINYNKGSVVVLEGEENQGFIYLVKSGVLQIDSKVKFKNKSLNFYTSGDTFGYVSGLLKKTHHHTIVASENTSVVKMTIEYFFSFLRQNPETFLKFLSSNSEKLRSILGNLRNASDVPVSENLPEQLIHDAETYMKFGQQNKGLFAYKKYLDSEFTMPKIPGKDAIVTKIMEDIDQFYTLPQWESLDDESPLFKIPQDTVIFVEHEPDDGYFYVIEKGNVNISKLSGENEILLETIREGEIFGEMAILNHKSRAATAVTISDCEILRLTKEDMFSSKNDSILVKIFFQLAKRFYLSNQRFLIRNIDSIVDQLYLQLEVLLDEKLNLNYKSKQLNFDVEGGIKIEKSLDELFKMIGVKSVEKDKISDFLKDKALRFESTYITVLNPMDYRHRAGIVANRVKRTLKELVI